MKSVMEFIKDNGITKFTLLSLIIASIGRVTAKYDFKLMQLFVDALGENNRSEMIRLLVLFSSINLLSILIFHTRHLISSQRENVVKPTLDRYYNHILHLPYQAMTDLDQSKILNSISGIEPTVDFCVQSTQNIAYMVVQPMVIIAILAGISKLLTVIIVIITTILAILIYKINKSISKYSKIRKEQKGKYYSALNRLKSFTVIKSFANEEFELANFGETTEKLKESGLQRKKSIRFLVDFIIFAYCLEEIIVAVVAFYYVPKGLMSVTEVLLVYMLVDELLAPFEGLADFMDEFQERKTDIEFYNQIMELEEEKDGLIETKSFEKEITFKNVSFSYKDSDEVLYKVNFNIKKGEKIGIYGPSGGGKSTLVSLINRINSPTKGKILLDGVDISQINHVYLRHLVGIVSQNIEIFGDSTIRENIAYGINATESDIIEAAKKANCHEFISRLKDGYDSIVGDNGVKLSGGEAQRIALARLFLLNPPIIVLDESTSKLDNESEKIVQEAIDKLSDNRTVIAIAHRLSTIKNFDKLVGIDCHKIVEIGDNQSLMNDQNSLWYKLNV